LKFFNEIEDKQKSLEAKLLKLENDLKRLQSHDSPPPSLISTRPPPQPVFQPDRKFNIVVYGIDESPPNTNRPSRLQKDIKNVLTAFTPIVTTLEPNAIKDCFRLGKFNPNGTRPRPLMVIFLRSVDVSSILSNRKLLKSPIFIKPDMSVEERKNEALLLKERRSLIEKGVAQNKIKLRGSTLFVDNQPHCKIHNFQLQSCDSQTDSNQTDSASNSN